jgi:hypothetical protein
MIFLPHRLIQTRTHNHVFAGVEHRAHNIVSMPCQNRQASSTLPIPYSNGLIIRRRENPRVLVMELHCSDVIEMALQSEEAAFLLVIPNFDFVVVATGDE